MKAASTVLLATLLASLGEAQTMIGAYQAVPECYAYCDSRCDRRILESSRDLQASCNEASFYERFACGCDYPNITVATKTVLLAGQYPAGQCINATLLNGLQPASIRGNCNGNNFITTMEFFNDTSDCSGANKKNLAIDTRGGNFAGLFEGPGGFEGFLLSFLDQNLALKCVTGPFLKITEYSDEECEVASPGYFGEAAYATYTPLGSCSQVLDGTTTYWYKVTLNGTNVKMQTFGDVTDEREGTCTGEPSSVNEFPLGACVPGNGKMLVWTLSGTSSVMMSAIIGFGAVAVSAFMV